MTKKEMLIAFKFGNNITKGKNIGYGYHIDKCYDLSMAIQEVREICYDFIQDDIELYNILRKEVIKEGYPEDSVEYEDRIIEKYDKAIEVSMYSIKDPFNTWELQDLQKMIGFMQDRFIKNCCEQIQSIYE